MNKLLLLLQSISIGILLSIVAISHLYLDLQLSMYSILITIIAFIIGFFINLVTYNKACEEINFKRAFGSGILYSIISFIVISSNLLLDIKDKKYIVAYESFLFLCVLLILNSLNYKNSSSVCNVMDRKLISSLEKLNKFLAST